MKVKLLRDYLNNPPGREVEFPASVAELLIRRGIAKAVEVKSNKSMAARKYRNK